MIRKRRRTWITRHREDQRDITRLCLFMAFLVTFHLVMRELMIYSFVTLRVPTRLTMENINLPHRVMDIIILISCLILACALIHFFALIRKRAAIGIIAASLAISASCLITNGMIMRTILKTGEPKHVARLDPRTVIIDVSKRGWITISNAHIHPAQLKGILEKRRNRDGHVPVIICADRRARFSDVARTRELCNAAGLTDIELARQRGFEKYDVPDIFEKGAAGVSTNRISTVTVLADRYVLEGQELDVSEFERQLIHHIEQHKGNRHVIHIAGNARHEHVMHLLKLYHQQGVTNLATAPVGK